MANKSIFQSIFSKAFPKTDSQNHAGGIAYKLTPKQALAQFAATGCFNDTFYATAQMQLADMLVLTTKVEPEFLARLALYTRREALMKDMPAFLVAVLSVRSPGLGAEVFDRVIDSPRMLRTFVQIMRSGVTGRKSLGTLPKRMIQQWFISRSDEQLFRASVGNSPSLADIIKLAHVKPNTPTRAAFFAYLLQKPHDFDALPQCVRDYEIFKGLVRIGGIASTDAVPDVPMEMLTSFSLTREQWTSIALRASWQTLRMNLSTFARHNVWKDELVAQKAAARLRDPEQVRAARVLPYQLMVAHANANKDVPRCIKAALHDAMEVAIANVPTIHGKVWVCPDVSGSMQSPITGERKGAATAVRCIDVAALVAAAVLRKNEDAGVLPFSDDVLSVSLEPRDTVITNAQKLASLPSGGTNCSAPLAKLNREQAKGDLVILVSDNESWIDSAGRTRGSATATMTQWRAFKQRNPRAKLVCIDLQPNAHTQAVDWSNAKGVKNDVLNIGGFADTVFETIAHFAQGTLNGDHWVQVVEGVSL